MGSPVTGIRLITIGDAGAITEHIRRDRETKGRWEPAYPPDYFPRRTVLAADRDRAVARTEIIEVELVPPSA